ncbi:MAG: four helix bundle protein [Candidatus Stahlbacteria bacterium]|nr:four helix bundle protein [Candidatus Stahlbacteria bacterium]
MINSKSETLNPKQIPITKIQNTKQYDLEGITLKFAKEVIAFVRSISRTIPNMELIKQLVRSSTSVGANYIEANESLSKKDFVLRIKICRKESKESIYWLKLIEIESDEMEQKRDALIQEGIELMKIFGSIVEKAK